MIRPRVFAIVLPLLALSACGRPTHLVYVQQAGLGVDASITGEGVSKLVIGFDRDVFAIVPKLPEGEEAMTLTSVSNVRAVGVSEMTFHHVVATGAAGINLANDPEGLRMIRKAVYEEADE